MAMTAREIMTPDPVCVRSSDSVLDAATWMAELGVGALPICGEDNRLKGLITDRDIVVKVIAAANDPRAAHVGSAEEILATMSQHQVRRLPVIDGHDLIGIIALADVALSVDR